MTSEIAVMNRLAVALAADSAVSVTDGRKSKVYNSANKLFMLSKYHPVGIMVYDNGSLMGVPWEVIIKDFRLHLGSGECEHLEDYANQFFDYIESLADLFTSELAAKYYEKMINSQFATIARQIRQEIESNESDLAGTADWGNMQAKVVRDIIAEELDLWSNYCEHPDIAPGTGSQLRGDVSGKVAGLIAKHFSDKGWSVGPEQMNNINSLADAYVDKDYIAESSFSGIVFAGFGRKDYFPVLARFRVGHFYGGKLKKISTDVVRVSESKPVHVGAYADSDSAELFFKGMSIDAIDAVIQKSFLRADELVREILNTCNISDSDVDWAQLDAARDSVLHKLVGDIDKYRDSENGFNQALTHAPKDELARVAASLVSLNTFKKRMSMNAETVGGPVDVAVISKGDGFIWIDRKHYFDADKNPHFMHRASDIAIKLGEANG